MLIIWQLYQSLRIMRVYIDMIKKLLLIERDSISTSQVFWTKMLLKQKKS